jgi:hypothetical protein
MTAGDPARDDGIITEADLREYLAGLRRRREASRRLPPLRDGRQDPLDPLPGWC